MSESSSFPTPEKQMSPLLLYYNIKPDGLLGATLLMPPTAALIHSEAGPGTNASGLGTLPALPRPPQCGNHSLE